VRPGEAVATPDDDDGGTAVRQNLAKLIEDRAPIVARLPLPMTMQLQRPITGVPVMRDEHTRPGDSARRSHDARRYFTS
jgi:hypothetical protein